MIAERLERLLKNVSAPSEDYGWPESKLQRTPEVHQFLQVHTNLQVMATEACGKLRKAFPGARIAVDTLVDPDDGGDLLCFDVYATGTGSELRSRLDQMLAGYEYPAEFIFSVFPAK